MAGLGAREKKLKVEIRKTTWSKSWQETSKFWVENFSHGHFCVKNCLGPCFCRAKLGQKTWSKSGRRASGPREKKLKLKFRKELGVIVGGGPRGPGRKS